MPRVRVRSRPGVIGQLLICVRAFLRGILFSISEMTAGAKGQGHDGEGGAGNSTAGEGASVGDDEVRRVPNLVVAIEH